LGKGVKEEIKKVNRREEGEGRGGEGPTLPMEIVYAPLGSGV